MKMIFNFFMYRIVLYVLFNVAGNGHKLFPYTGIYRNRISIGTRHKLPRIVKFEILLTFITSIQT